MTPRKERAIDLAPIARERKFDVFGVGRNWLGAHVDLALALCRESTGCQMQPHLKVGVVRGKNRDEFTGRHAVNVCCRAWGIINKPATRGGVGSRSTVLSPSIRLARFTFAARSEGSRLAAQTPKGWRAASVRASPLLERAYRPRHAHLQIPYPERVPPLAVGIPAGQPLGVAWRVDSAPALGHRILGVRLKLLLEAYTPVGLEAYGSRFGV